ncbi:pyridoxal phosphate-dependent aminotransferase [Nocardioides sp. MAHUQ-72]|uniref:pyridoxal phosphate-dependent aminotransferase n=1 Tax=unclassified Nocardioides TaxID=2615069 RepID=UPI003620959A
MTGDEHTLPAAESRRVRRMHMPGRSKILGATVREADLALHLDGGGKGLLDTTHFDTVRFPPPAWATDVMQSAMEDGVNAYTPYRGNPSVLEVTADSVSRLLGVTVDEQNLLLTPGTQGGIFTMLSALVDEGDLVMLADPEYLFVERMLAFLGARVERIPVLHDRDEATLDFDAIERLLPQRPRLLLFSHPSNPTGAVYGDDVIARVAELSQGAGFRVLVDELYSRLVYGDRPFRHLAAEPGMADRCITMLGPSKTESLSGFRLGVVVAPADVVAAGEQTLAITALRAPAYAQHLLTRWLRDDQDFLAERVKALQALRDMTADRLCEVPGLHLRVHDGTAYLFPDVSALGRNDREIAGALRREAGVIVSPGYQFGERGTGHFRVCYARDEDEWAAALDRMVACLQRLAS